MRWFFLLPLSFAMLFIALFLNPAVALFANRAGWLPKWLWWFQTPDYPIDGDPPFQEHHAPFKGEVNAFQRWVNRTTWLYRNPNYGFDWTVLAYTSKEEETLEIKGTRPLGGELHHNGWYFARQGYAWQLYITHHWNETHTTKINLGWKLWGTNPHQYVCSLGFWKKL